MPKLRTDHPVTPVVVPFGHSGRDTLYVNGSEIKYWTNFNFTKTLNSTNSFSVNFLGVGSEERNTIVKNDNEVMLFQDNDLFLKGTVHNTNYGGNNSARMQGIGQEIKLTRRDVEREEYTNFSTSGIITRLCSADLSGGSPFLLNIGSNVNYGNVSVKGEHISRLNYVTRVLDRVGWDWRVDTSGNDYSRDYLVVGSYIGDTVPQVVFRTSGADQNVVAVRRNVDDDSIANIVKVLGYGGGVNQTIGSFSDSSSIQTYGSRYATYTDRSIINSAFAGSLASGLVNQLKTPPISYALDVLGIYNTGSDFDVGDQCTLIDNKLDVNDDFRVQSVTRTNGTRGPRMLVQVGNRRRANSDILERLRYSTGTTETFAMGDTIVYQSGETDNCDGSNGLRIDFFIPKEMVTVNTIKLNYRITKYRVWSSQASSGGGSTTGGGGGATETTTDESSHTHTVDVIGDTGSYAIGFEVRVTSPVLYRNSDVSSSWFNVNRSTTAHDHDVVLFDHTHSTPNHTHDLTYGITTDPNAYAVTDMTIDIDSVDKTTDYEAENGTLNVTENSTNGNNVILADWLGSPIPNAWHTIELKPDDNCRIQADIFIQGFIEDKVVS